MKRIIAIMALSAVMAAQAQNSIPLNGAEGFATSVVGIERTPLGSGAPGFQGYELAKSVLENDIFHAPQYMPFYPTAGVIYPRVIEVPCTNTKNVMVCDSYNWSPKMGRAEYLFFKPVLVKAPEVQVIEKQVLVPVPGPRVFVERKPKKE